MDYLTPEDMFAHLPGSHVFSIINLSDANLQVEADDDSKKLLIINTHKEVFQFNRLAPVMKSAPEAFQRMVDSMIVADIPGIRSFIYDINSQERTQRKQLFPNISRRNY